MPHKVAIRLFLYFQIVIAIEEDEIVSGGSSLGNTSAIPEHYGSLVKVLLRTSLPASLESVSYKNMSKKAKI